MEESKVWLNGKMVPHKDVTVPLLSHGFSRASAIFEAFGTHSGPNGSVAFRMDQHLKRLMHSANMLEMNLPYSLKEMAAAVAETVTVNGVGRGLVKMMAYWSEEAVISLVLDSPLDLAIYTIPASDDLGLDNATPATACLSKWRKLHPETIPATSKACANYLNGYLARKDAMNRGFNIGVMLGTDGFLAEGSIESVFIVKDGVLKVPPLGRVLNSISRKSIVEAAPSIGIPVEQGAITAAELFDADEIFTAHTGIRVLPIKQFEDRKFDAPGPVTQKVKTLMADILEFKNPAFMDWFQPMS